MSEEKGKFKGVWIPADLFTDPALTFAEKALLGYMGSFNGNFFASDLHVATKMGTSEQVIANMMFRLRKKGYLIGRKPNPEVRSHLTQKLAEPNSEVSIEQRRAKCRSKIRSGKPDNSSLKLTISEIEDLVADWGLASSVAASVFYSLENDNWRDSKKLMFRSRSIMISYIKARAEKFDEDLRSTAKPKAVASW